METMNHGDVIKRQRERILGRIEKADNLLDEYESKRLSSDDPREKLRAEEAIAEIEELIAKYKSQLKDLEQEPARTIDPRAPRPLEGSPSSGLSKEHEKPAQNQDASHVLNVDELDRKLDKLQQGIDELKHGQAAIHNLLSETRNQELQAILSLVRKSDGQHEQTKQMLGVIQDTVTALQAHRSALSDEVKNALADASSVLNSEASLQGKLEVTLPIIPLLLDYKVELAATNSVDLNRLRENLQSWWRSVTRKVTGSTWPLSALIEYGHHAQEKHSWDEMEPVQAAQRSLQQYQQRFKTKDDTIQEFESKINRNPMNLNIWVRAREETLALSGLARSFAEELGLLRQTIDFPRNDLDRIAELAGSVADQADSAAGMVALNTSPSPPINQIRRNLPALRRAMKNLLTWFQQTTGGSSTN